jgi:hypothetical protein
MSRTFGTDSSIYQPTYDGHYKVLKDNGGTFDIIRAGQGTSFVDDSLDEHYANDKAAGLKMGLYHWIDPEKTGRANADFFSRIIDQYSNIEVIVGDHEQWWEWASWSLCYEKHQITPGEIVRLPPNQIFDVYAVYFDTLLSRYAPQKKVVEYTAKWFLDGFQKGLDTWSVAKRVFKWLAAYINLGKGDVYQTWEQFHQTMDGQTGGPPVPTGWEQRWDIWQFTSNYLIPGMPRIDWNMVNPASGLVSSLGGDAVVAPPPAGRYCVYLPNVQCQYAQNVPIPEQPPVPEQPTVLFRAYVNCSWLTVKDGPGADYNSINWIPLNTPLDILEVQYSWGRYSGGWVNLSYTRK